MLDPSSFAYDQQAPLALEVLAERVQSGAIVREIAWYDNCNHELNAQARLDRATWLCETLHLAQPSQEIMRLLEEVPSPTLLES